LLVKESRRMTSVHSQLSGLPEKTKNHEHINKGGVFLNVFYVWDSVANSVLIVRSGVLRHIGE